MFQKLNSFGGYTLQIITLLVFVECIYFKFFLFVCVPLLLIWSIFWGIVLKIKLVKFIIIEVPYPKDGPILVINWVIYVGFKLFSLVNTLIDYLTNYDRRKLKLKLTSKQKFKYVIILMFMMFSPVLFISAVIITVWWCTPGESKNYVAEYTKILNQKLNEARRQPSGYLLVVKGNRFNWIPTRD